MIKNLSAESFSCEVMVRARLMEFLAVMRTLERESIEAFPRISCHMME
jgi:hypothetical protein